MNAVAKTLINRSTINRIVRCNAHAGRASWIQESRPQALAVAMLRDEDLQPARIPFDGFYNSFLTAAFDEGIEHELEWRLEEADSVACSLTRDELEDCARGCVISDADAVEIASAWVDRYEDYLSDAANDLADENDQQDSIRLHFASYAAEAPAGYHEDICETCDFAGYVRKRFTPASGWIPFFSADVRRWGPVTTWNAAQLGVLLDFICPDRRLTEYGLGDRLTEEIDTLASAALSKRITAYCCEDAA